MRKPAESREHLTWPRFLRQTVGAALVMGLSLLSYLVVLKWRGSAAAIQTQTAWDRAIPFWPAWLYVYLLPYVIGPPLLGVLSRETFRWYVRRGLLTVAISLVIFVLIPTRTVRPTEEQMAELGDGFIARHYRDMVRIDDPPANAAPSLHVSLSCLLAFALTRDFPHWWLVSLAGVGLLWLATLFTWQHHLIDVLTGVLLGSAVALPWPNRSGASRGRQHPGEIPASGERRPPDDAA